MSQDIWVVTDKADADDFLLRAEKYDDAGKVAQRFMGCKILKQAAVYDIRVAQAIKDDLFPLIPVLERPVDEPVRSRASSHPELPHQPLLSPGKHDPDGLYKNSFGRKGKELHSEIFVKKGVMNEIEKYYTQFLPAPCLTAKNFVVVDEICNGVMDIDELFVNTLAKVGVVCEKIVVPSDFADASGETSTEPFKNNDVFTACVNQILAAGVSKHSCIISVGGGVINNMCGVLAGLIYRGIHLVHFTTTTMGMLDAALDFKQAINHDLGKNLLGCYYPAEKIIIDPECCKTLSARHIRNGIAEALKHGLCQSRDLVERIVQPVRERGEAALSDPDYLQDICQASIEIKVPTLDHYAESDFNEMCPQYGHSIGHAVESLSWTHSHEPLLHGEAVAIGMCVSAEISFARGYCSQECLEEHYSYVLGLGLPAYIPATMDVSMILKKIVFDKHYVRVPSMGLVASIGEMAYNSETSSFAFAVEIDELTRAVEANMARSCFCYVC